jgi:hypothetical protein
MFLALAPLNQANAETTLALDPAAVSYAMDATWSAGGPGRLTGTGGQVIATPNRTPIGANLPTLVHRVWTPVWDHLIYAYMVENTRVYEIMGRVIAEYTQGERLGIPGNDASYQWLRTTEEVFYKDASPIQPFNLISRLRPDIAATRRNAYFRMFGMDLNHGRDGAPSYPYLKPTVANREFVATFEEFLREVWRAIENASNFLAGNPTDFPAIQDLAIKLQNMLIARRGGAATRPNLAREEFLAVSLAAWLHLTLSFNTPIVRDLSASGPSPEERLRQIGERVGLPSHGRSHDYFRLATRVSTLLIQLELGDYSTRAGAETLAAPGPVKDNVAEVIHHWVQISGRDLKSAARVTLSPTGRSAAAPLPAAPGAISAAPGTAAVAVTNGRVPAGSP